MGFLQRFFYGRYGMDALGKVTMVACLALDLLSCFINWWWLYWLAMALAAVTLYRMLSRNIVKRQQENARFLNIFALFRTRVKTRRAVRGDKEHRYFKCPHCGQQLRAPKGVGNIRVTCRTCGTSFEKNV